MELHNAVEEAVTRAVSSDNNVINLEIYYKKRKKITCKYLGFKQVTAQILGHKHFNEKIRKYIETNVNRNIAN